MLKNVLLVDDDREMLVALKQGFKKHQESFSVILAEDGVTALEKLKANFISLVVTDLKMPRMDGFELLAHVMQHFPEIPVIIITGYSTPEMERLAREGGAVGYISKPFLIENLARKIMTTLSQESEGGALHNVSSAIFLQLIEMEQKTCTIRLEQKSSSNKGILFFLEGELFDARANDLQGIEAAQEILSWDQVNLSIQNGCALKHNKINKDLQYLLLEATRRKDEKKSPQTPVETKKPRNTEQAPPVVDRLQMIRQRIERELGRRGGLEGIYRDPSWNARLTEFAAVGDVLDIGTLKIGYINKGDPHDYILVPGSQTTVIAVDPKCPRDKLLQLLAD